MLKITQNLVRYTKNTVGVQVYVRFNNFASVPITAAVRSLENDENNEPKITQDSLNTSKFFNRNSNLVAAAFASLKSDTNAGEVNRIPTPFTDSRISNAKTVDDLLSISEGTGVSRRHALKVVSILSDWTVSKKVNIADFEADPRFIRLCKVLTKGHSIGRLKNFSTLRNEDLSTIINVTADDEAAKLITSISLPQMVKVMSTLAQKKRRSTPLLRSLAFNITRNGESLDLKQSADLLYSSAVLNFMDENLLEKVNADLRLAIGKNEKGSAVVGSILTSLGILRYKDKESLDLLSDWILRNQKKCRPQDVFSLFITLAILNHEPSNSEKLYEVILPQLNLCETNKPSLWLDYVWSLVVLKQAKTEHVSSVLNDSFIKKLQVSDTGLTTASKLKLLNIESASKLLMENYNGPTLPEDLAVKTVVISKSKSKEAMINSVQDSLSNLFNENHLKTNINTGMGFSIDAELRFDEKSNPLPMAIGENNGTKVALMVYDYHDFCRGRLEPTGIVSLSSRLLKAKNYRLLTIPYTDFDPKDKLVTRVQYLEAKLKNLVR